LAMFLGARLFPDCFRASIFEWNGIDSRSGCTT